MKETFHTRQTSLPAPPETRRGSTQGQSHGSIAASRPWRPITLRTTYLAALIMSTTALIAIISDLLIISKRDHGILFAKNINQLPLRSSFPYLYLPTVISVLYSFLWSWVDLDIKRLEPYFQLSRRGGAKASNSILLSYPLEFLAAIPLKAFRSKHWSVLSASMIMIMVFWGITPAQSGLFAVRTVHIDQFTKELRSFAYTPLDQQGNLTADYAQSVYNIAWLNESLPPFMTKDYILDAIAPAVSAPDEATSANFTGFTTMYSVDVQCEQPLLWNNSGTFYYNSSTGCSFYAPPYRPQGGNDSSKPFDAMYVGYQNQNGFATYYLGSDCGERFLHNFFVRWSKSTPEAIMATSSTGGLKPSQANETALFCTPRYYKQSVYATISLPSNEVLYAAVTGEPEDLPADLFNVSTFEWAMSSGQEQFPARGALPTTGFPDQKPQLQDMPLNLAFIPPTAPFAIATHPLPAEIYMDPQALRLSYQSAYRLLFTRQLADILNRTTSTYGPETGHLTYVTQAVVVVPVFAGIAIGLLAVVLLLAIHLLLVTKMRPNKLKDDPSSIASLINLVKGDVLTADAFITINEHSTEGLEKSLRETEFSMRSTSSGSDYQEVRLRANKAAPRGRDTTLASSGLIVSASEAEGACVRTGVRPAEMKLIVGAIFLSLQITALVAFVVLYYKAKAEHGLALPSESTFLRQLVENYIPIAFATFIEPVWLLLNRLLCLLQPYEELRNGPASAAKSVNLDYGSVPPQFLFLRSVRAGHIILSLVCLMVLLANILAVALNGLMYEDSISIPNVTTTASNLSARFVALNGTGLPFNANEAQNWDGGTTSDQFYHMMSNLTAGTPLPPWIDNKYTYLPRDISKVQVNSTLESPTTAFGAELQCKALEQQNYSLTFTADGRSGFLNTFLGKDDGAMVDCTNFQQWTDDDLRVLADPQPGHVALELGSMLTNNRSAADDLFCRQHLLFSWLRVDWKVINGSVGSGPGLQYYDQRVMQITSRNETMLLCTPTIEISLADITVDHTGRVQGLKTVNISSTTDASHFASTKQDLIAQANQFLAATGVTWHKDSYPSDFINYLIKESTNNTSLLDPTASVPNPEHAAQQLALIYRKLFAILIGTNSVKLFEELAEPILISVIVYTSETRIVFSTPAFIVTFVILICYIVTTVFFYARRPWRILPRLPSTPASNIAYFAASRALRGRSREEDGDNGVKGKETLWSYGEFVGLDGKRHVGIEHSQYVTVPRKRGRVEKAET